MASYRIQNSQIQQINKTNNTILIAIPISKQNREKDQASVLVFVQPEVTIKNDYGGSYQFVDLRVGFPINVVIDNIFYNENNVITADSTVLTVVHPLQNITVENFIVEINLNKRLLCVGNKGEIINSIVSVKF